MNLISLYPGLPVIWVHTHNNYNQRHGLHHRVIRIPATVQYITRNGLVVIRIFEKHKPDTRRVSPKHLEPVK